MATRATRATKVKATPVSASTLARSQKVGGHVASPPPDWIAQVLPGLLEAYGAFGYQLGMKRERGRWLRQPSLVFLTEKKGAPQARGIGKTTIPKFLTWQDGKRRHRMPTDVIEVAAQIELQAATVFGPGDGAEFRSEVATVGAAVRSPLHGDCLTTAGHLLGGSHNVGRQVKVDSGGLRVVATAAEVVVSNATDYALLKLPMSSPCANLFRDQIRIGPVFTPTSMDLGTVVHVLDRFGRATPTVCRAVDQRLFGISAGFKGVIVTDPVTQPGQSGGALIDGSNRLWGFVLGAMPGRFSVFAPAQSVFDSAGVSLIK